MEDEDDVALNNCERREIWREYSGTANNMLTEEERMQLCGVWTVGSGSDRWRNMSGWEIISYLSKSSG